jgi:para-nitrobenzyl esterase
MHKIFFILLTSVLVGCAGLPHDRSLAEPVQTEGGLVSGTGTDVHTFRGIPYAMAPIGDLRWRAPQPAPAWAGTRDGSQFGPDCMQPAEYPELRGKGMSEDCLSLNVWTPAQTAAQRLPVMVWIYGGGFTYGSGSHPTYDGEALARRGIVVVTINYRVGLFGFMAHPQLSAESPARSSGNYALMDQIAALQWVQRNIAAFGGDASKVTVAGQSAGALAISSLLTSDQARGLFQQAILQSVGVMRPMSTLAAAEQFGVMVGPDISKLRQISGPELVQRLKDVNPPGREMTSSRGLGVIVDGTIVPRADRVSYAQGRFPRIPMIVGSVANEGGGIARSLGLKTVAEARNYVARNFAGSEGPAQQLYNPANDGDVLGVMSDLASDTQFNYGTREMLRITAAREQLVYRYLFTQRRNSASTQPIHGDELQYPFDNLRAPHRGRLRPFDETDTRVASEMADAWARFVKTGNPNGGTLPAWQPFDRTAERYLEFGRDTRSATFGAAPRLDMIRDYYARQNP